MQIGPSNSLTFIGASAPGGTGRAGDTDSQAASAKSASQEATAPAKKKINWPGRPQKVLPVADVKVALYQFDGVTLEGKPGALLVFTSKLPEGRFLLGSGFVLESDTHDADQAVLKSVQSLRHDEAAAAAGAK